MSKRRKNKTRIAIMLLIFLMVTNIGNAKMLSVQAAGATYNPQKAIEYAAAHWNDGVGECAEFVSNCVIAGGINIKVNKMTDPMMNAICNATGLQIQDLTLDSYKHATKTANEGKLAAGDVVGLYCVTCGETPHVLFCGGFDSNGRALYYAHNKPKNMQLFQIKDTSLKAKHSGHKIVGKVIHLSGLPLGDVQGPDTEKPVITDVWVDEVSNQGYTVYCKATDNTQILKVSFATWTDYNGQDDLKNEWWDKNAVMQPVSGNTYAFRVNTADHNEEAGLYTTDVYAYDTNYNYVMQRVQVNIDKTSPIISAYIENVDATGYTVVCKAVDDVEMARVCFPTWTIANGQDDLDSDWYNNCAVVGKGNDGVYTYRVNVADHNNEYGEYETHIYAYDTSGNYIQGRAPKAQVPKGLPFPDVKPGAWYYNSIAAVYEAGLMNGRADGTFGPNLNLTRAEVATVLYNKENKPYVAYVNCFSDVKDGMWYSAPISWAYRKGIASGYGNGKFGVGDNISREQMAQMLYAYAKMKGYDVSYTDGAINQYGDSSKVSSWAKPAMNWAISKGIMSGKGSGSDLSKYKLEPQGSTTRAECAAMLKNFMDVYGR